MLQTIESLKDLKGKKVLVRVDFNVPQKEGVIRDDNRIRAALPTINYLVGKGARVILMSHLGKIKWKEPDQAKIEAAKKANDMACVAKRLAELVAPTKVEFCPVTHGEELAKAAEALHDGEILLMQNTRYDRNQDGNGMTYAVLENRNGDRFLYGFILGDLISFSETKYGYAYEKAYYVDLSGCTDIAEASQFAFSSLKTYLYYAVGRKVYRVNFDASAPSAELQFELPADEEITLMKFYLWEQDDPDNHSYDLIVASRKSGTGEGVLRIYDGFAREGDFSGAEPVEQYGGFADIVDVIYRESIVYQQ